MESVKFRSREKKSIGSGGSVSLSRPESGDRAYCLSYWVSCGQLASEVWRGLESSVTWVVQGALVLLIVGGEI